MHTHMHNYCINIYVRNTLEHIQGCMHTRGMKQTHTYTDAYTQTYICMCIHECMQTHATYMHTFTYTYTNKCTHTSTHRHTLAHIHIHAHRCCRRIGRNPFKYFLNVWSILSILRTCNHSDGWLINITHTHTHTDVSGHYAATAVRQNHCHRNRTMALLVPVLCHDEREGF